VQTQTLTAELYLRLLVEDAVAALPLPVDEVARRLRELVIASSALVAVGAVERAVAVGVARDAETALLVRGNEWLELDLGDLPDVREVLDAQQNAPAAPAELVSVVAHGGVVVERWTDHARVRTGGESWVLPGGIDDASRAITIAVGGEAREVPLTPEHRARRVDARVGGVDVRAFVASLDDERRAVAERALRACGLLDG
jgi:hypothetical protein